jgi:transcriptional regulator with XRE-family HTH domain
MSKTLGRKIKELREKAEMTQTELGKLLGVKLRQVQRYEEGLFPGTDKLKVMETRFQYDLFRLIREGNETEISETDEVESQYFDLKNARVDDNISNIGLLNTVLHRIASLTETQNQILKQNQVQIVGGIGKIKEEITHLTLDNRAQASAISDEIRDWSLQILKALKGHPHAVFPTQSDKTVRKQKAKHVKQGNHNAVGK